MTTIQDMIDKGDRLFAHCGGGNNCFHSQELDLEALKAKLGPDHGTMHDDLVPLLRCKKCRSKKVGITIHPNSSPKSDLASPYEKAKGHMKRSDAPR
jgi:hypothetical protein